MKISTIVVTYNGYDYIEKCLRSLDDSSFKTEVIVIDNNSTDATVQVIEEYFPDVILSRQKKNIGFGKANNLGIRYALNNGSDYMFLLNQDAWIEKDTIQRLIEVAEKQEKLGIISPLHLNSEGGELDYHFSNYLSSEICPGFISDMVLSKTKSFYEIEFVNCAAWLVSKKCFEVVGGFNPLFHLYGEDLDYIRRVNYHGLKVGICTDVTICHARDNFIQKVLKNNMKKRLILQKYYNKNLAHLTNIEKPYYSNLILVYTDCIKQTIKNILSFDPLGFLLCSSFFVKNSINLFRIARYRVQAKRNCRYLWLK